MPFGVKLYLVDQQCKITQLPYFGPWKVAPQNQYLTCCIVVRFTPWARDSAPFDLCSVDRIARRGFGVDFNRLHLVWQAFDQDSLSFEFPIAVNIPTAPLRDAFAHPVFFGLYIPLIILKLTGSIARSSAENRLSCGFKTFFCSSRACEAGRRMIYRGKAIYLVAGFGPFASQFRRC